MYDDFIMEDLKEEESIRADNEAVNREDPLKEIIWEDIKRNYRESMYNFYNSVPPEENPSWKETLYNLTIESADKAIEYLQKENEELKEEYRELKNDKYYWYDKYIPLEKKYVSLVDKHRVLKEEYEELKEENGKLREYYKDLKKENDKLKVMLFDAAMMMTDMMEDEDCNEVE